MKESLARLLFAWGLAQLPLTAVGANQNFFEEEFVEKTGCFILIDLKKNESFEEFNPKRCRTRLAPMSTFKIPLTIMAFDSGYLTSPAQVIEWDGKGRGRESVNRDQTARTFLKSSVIWVSRLIVKFLGKKRLQRYVDSFDYGNKQVTGNLGSFWLSRGSVKISGYEQVEFLSRFWQGELLAKREAVALTKSSLPTQRIGKWSITGKTGTGCVDEGCMKKPGRQLGWFVGVAESHEKVYAFALNFTDRVPQKGFGGPRARKIVHRYFAAGPRQN